MSLTAGRTPAPEVQARIGIVRGFPRLYELDTNDPWSSASIVPTSAPSRAALITSSTPVWSLPSMLGSAAYDPSAPPPLAFVGP